MKPIAPEPPSQPAGSLSFETVLAQVVPAPDVDPASLPADENALLELTDGERPVSELLWLSGKGGTVVMRALQSLMDRGLVSAVPRPPRRGAGPPLAASVPAVVPASAPAAPAPALTAARAPASAPTLVPSPAPVAALRPGRSGPVAVAPAPPAAQTAGARGSSSSLPATAATASAATDTPQPLRGPADIPAPRPALQPLRALSTPVGQPDETTRLGGYQVITRMAQGGMGSIYLCRRARGPSFPRLFTLKAIREHGPETTAVVRSFLREAQIGAMLTHPHVLPVLDMGTYQGQPFLILEYVEGTSLADLVIDKQPTAASLVVSVVVDVLRGLQAAHDLTDAQGQPLGLVHGDVSPENILVGTDGAARLTDFGSARFTSAAARSAAAAAGDDDDKAVPLVKPGYLSPEQLRGEPLDPRADIFSVGVVLWSALTGHKLFSEGGYEQTVLNVLRRKIAPPSAFGAPRALDEICMRALLRPREGRYASADEMAHDLLQSAVATGLHASGREVAVWVKQAAADVLAERRLHIQRAASPGSEAVVIDADEPAPPARRPTNPAGTQPLHPLSAQRHSGQGEPEQQDDLEPVPGPRPVWLAVFAASLLSALATAAAMWAYFTTR